MDKTKLDTNNQHHRNLIALMAAFVEDYGYTPHELFQLLDHSKGQLFHALSEIHQESRQKKK